MTTPDRTESATALIRRQFALTRGMEEAFAAAFYGRLFQIAPALRPMFRHDLADQGRKLMTVLGFAVASLDRPEVLAPALRQLGQRHHGYGVTAADFAPVGAALLDTLATALGGDFTPAARQAWGDAITAMATVMAEAMAEAARMDAA